VKIEESVEIRRPVAEVFDFASDPAHWSRWASAFESVEAGDGSHPPAPGDVFRTEAYFMGKQVRTDFEVTAVDPPRFFGYRATRGPVPGEFRWTFSESGTGTRFHFEVEGEPKGLARMMAPMAAPAVRAQIRHDLDRLKKILEAG
jgi:uncharacterized protein YndB with AHSA1/START domain